MLHTLTPLGVAMAGDGVFDSYKEESDTTHTVDEKSNALLIRV